MRWQDVLWPTLEPPSDSDKARDAARLRTELEAIRDAVITADEDILIEEARRLADAEGDRRRTSETKAAIYLTIAGVLSPILATIAPEAFDPKDGWPKLVVTLLLFLFAGANLLQSGVWALRALVVQPSSRVDAADLVAFWAAPDRKAALAKALMTGVRSDRDRVNMKVTAVIMAHHFAVRAFVVFVLAVLVRSGWKSVATVFDQIGRMLG